MEKSKESKYQSRHCTTGGLRGFGPHFSLTSDSNKNMRWKDIKSKAECGLSCIEFENEARLIPQCIHAPHGIFQHFPGELGKIWKRVGLL